ncbi:MULTISPECIES: SMI1/KNR4 family protein [Chitinophaga]|nr:SMI1/KNR4 family protein [Chitinophaga polysaccharea]
MNSNFETGSEKISEEDIQSFEKSLNIQLPEAFRIGVGIYYVSI